MWPFASPVRWEECTYLPALGEDAGLAEVMRFLDVHERRSGDRVEPRYLLAGAGFGGVHFDRQQGSVT